MSQSGGDPDEDLVLRAGRGDAAAIQALTGRKLPRLLALASRMLGDASEAEDVAQDACLRMWRQAPNWRPGAAKFDTWLHRVALNLCFDRMRKRRDVLMDTLPDREDAAPRADALLEAQGTAALVNQALQRLPVRQREAIVLCHYQDLGNIEAALALQISVEALESLLSRGRRALRVSLADLAGR